MRSGKKEWQREAKVGQGTTYAKSEFAEEFGDMSPKKLADLADKLDDLYERKQKN